MNNFKVQIKDVAKHNTLTVYRNALQYMGPLMTLQEEIDWCLCTHIMEYKLLLKRIEKRLRNEQ